ncbi:MAG: putative lipopolysaccharide heptosyltransferase III [Gammaproteobacteria bacterium]
MSPVTIGAASVHNGTDDAPLRRVLIIKSRHIGDVLLTGPLIASIRRGPGNPRITALVKKGTEAMLRHHPGVDEVLTFPHREPGETSWAFLKRQWVFFAALRRRRFDLAITTTEGDRGIITARLSGASTRIGIADRDGPRWRRALLTDPRTPRQGRIHTVMRNLDLLPTGISPVPRVELGYPAEARARLDRLLSERGATDGRPLAAVHPGARWLFKCWTPAGMAAVIDHLSGRGFQVIVTGSPDADEQSHVTDVLKRTTTRPIALHDAGLSLLDAAAAIDRAKVFVGVDSAPMHMAAALDTPVVTLFGPSGGWDWGPWPNGWNGGDTPYPADHGTQRVGRHVIIQDIRPCVPCGRAGCDNTRRSACLEDLPVDRVLREIDITLEREGLVPPRDDQTPA